MTSSSTPAVAKYEKKIGLSEVSSKDYDFIPDFHPFLTSPRSQQVLSVPVTYFDDKTKQTAKIDIMGWYIKDQQLKIRWKPKYMRKRRWRSSRISVDIVTDNYFFQGQIYRDSSAPIFLNNLSFDSKIPKSFLPHLQKSIPNLYGSSRRTKKTGSPTKGPVKQ